MKRGTRVGQAYVAITADGSGINDDIADEFDKVDYRAIGKDHGAKYRESLREHLNGLDKDFSKIVDRMGSKDIDQWGNRISSRLGKAIESDSAMDDHVSRMLAKAFDSGKLDDLIQHVGRKAGVTFGGEFDRTVTAEVLSSLEHALNRAARDGNLDLSSILRGMTSGGGQVDIFGPVLDDAVRAVEAAHKKMEADAARSLRERATMQAAALRMNEKFDKDRIDAQQRLGKMQDQAYSIESKRQRDWLRTLDVARRLNVKFDNERLKAQQDMGRMQELANRLNEKFDKDREASLQRQLSLHVQALRLNEKFDLGRLDGNGQSVSGNRGGKDRDVNMSAAIGKMFGAGSRNNGLNLLGKSVGGIVGLVESAAKFAGDFSSNMDKAGNGASMLSRILSGFNGGGGGSAIFSRLGATAPMALAGIAAVVGGLSILVSVASAALGVLVALASTIASALVGAAAVGAGAFAALGAAVGLTALAFTSMTNAQSKALSSAFQPLKAEATGLGQILLRELVPSFDTYSKALQRALLNVEPLARAMSGGLHEAFHILTDSLSGPGVRMFLNALTVTLPGIVVNLSRAFGGFLNGVSAVFAALMPYVLRFSAYLSNVAADFARWATSAKGQNSIKDFVDRALTSLMSLWNFVKAVGGLISTLLFNPKGQKVGNSIFDSMARGVRRFTDYISSENRLENWFKKAHKFAKVLGKAIEGIGRLLVWLDTSAVIDGLMAVAKFLEKAAGWAKKLGGWIEKAEGYLDHLLGPIDTLGGGMHDIATDAERTRKAMSEWEVPPGVLAGTAALNQLLLGPLNNGNAIMGPISPYIADPNFTGAGYSSIGGGGSASSLADLINSGNNALNHTFESNGGYMPDPKDKDKKEWKNPYIKYANSILDDAPTLVEQIRTAAREASKMLRDAMKEARATLANAMTEVGKSFVSGIADAVLSTDFHAVQDSFFAIIDGAKTAGQAASDAAWASAQDMLNNATTARNQMVADAEAAVQSAAQRLHDATTAKEARAAQEDLRRAKEALRVATRRGDALVADAQARANALVNKAAAGQQAIERAVAIMAGQAVFTYENAANLYFGMKVETATLADYAQARAWAAEALEKANQQLADAIALRDNYASSVTDAAVQFASILSAQAKTVNGITQALTADDITDNLRDRLGKVKKFYDDLRILLAMGLSDEAYKQLVDAGVETGGAYVDALVAGGSGSITEVNDLTRQIGDVAGRLGDEASSHLYQAGVDAAQGLVDGLLSLSDQLDSAAARLGEAIVASIKKELGIASPSRVLMALMEPVGDGAVIGLNRQQVKVGNAAAALAGTIAVSPEVASYAARQGESGRTDDRGGVSGNDGNQPDPRFRDLIIQTPTEDPHAVAMETLNEITGRL